MGGKRSGPEASKRAAGQARKADAKAAKDAERDRVAEAAEAEKWKQGTKDGSKK